MCDWGPSPPPFLLLMSNFLLLMSSMTSQLLLTSFLPFYQVELFKGQLEASGVRVVTDCRLNYTPGWKYNHWELRCGSRAEQYRGPKTAADPSRITRHPPVTDLGASL